MEEKQEKFYYSLEIDEVIRKIENIINNTNLPYSILSLIINNFSKEIFLYAEKEKERDWKQQQRDLKQQENENNNASTFNEEQNSSEKNN